MINPPQVFFKAIYAYAKCAPCTQLSASKDKLTVCPRYAARSKVTSVQPFVHTLYKLPGAVLFGEGVALKLNPSAAAAARSNVLPLPVVGR